MYEKQIKRIVDYIKSGETPKNNFAIGAEFEHFIIDRENFNSIHYFSSYPASQILNDICKSLGAIPIKENSYTLGFKSKDYVVTTEPGSQFEVSINCQKNISDLLVIYKKFLNDIIPYFDKNGLSLLALGYHPKSKIDEIKILPKKRYDFMFDYFKSKGSMAHNMMKGSAATQVVIDFSDENDFKKKCLIANTLSPILYAIFDNSPIFESKHYEFCNLRNEIWKNTDPERSGILKIAFDDDFSYEKYAEYILNTNPIFIDKKDEELKSTKGKSFKELFDPDKDDDDFIYHALSIVFPDLRVKKYLEFRMMDSLPYPLNFSSISLIKGLFYDNNNLDILYNSLKGTSYDEVAKCKEDIHFYGVNAQFKGVKISDYALNLIKLCKNALSKEDIYFLNYLETLLKKNKSPKDLFLEIENHEGFKKAIENNYLKTFNSYL